MLVLIYHHMSGKVSSTTERSATVGNGGRVSDGAHSSRRALPGSWVGHGAPPLPQCGLFRGSATAPAQPWTPSEAPPPLDSTTTGRDRSHNRVHTARPVRRHVGCLLYGTRRHMCTDSAGDLRGTNLGGPAHSRTGHSPFVRHSISSEPHRVGTQLGPQTCNTRVPWRPHRRWCVFVLPVEATCRSRHCRCSTHGIADSIGSRRSQRRVGRAAPRANAPADHRPAGTLPRRPVKTESRRRRNGADGRPRHAAARLPRQRHAWRRSRHASRRRRDGRHVGFGISGSGNGKL